MTDIAAQTQTALTRIVAERQAKGRVPGVVGAVARAGSLAWSTGVGSADLANPGVPPTADSQFLIASQSKTLTAVAIMALRDEGKLSLDDTVEKLIPESKHEGITVRQMLSHASGMQREPVGDVWDLMKFPDRAELVSGWNEAERIGKPHHRFHYSNLVFSLLGEIVARLDGRPWYDAIKARILDPLEMRRTTVGMDGGPAATGYYVPPFSDVPVQEPLLDLGAMDACGGLASTAEDLAKWAHVRRRTRSTRCCRRTPWTRCARCRSWPTWTAGSSPSGSVSCCFAAATASSSATTAGCRVTSRRRSSTASPVRRGSRCSARTSSPAPSALATDLIIKVLEDDPLPTEPWVPGSTVPPELAGVLGTWFTEGHPFDFSVKNGVLQAKSPDAPEHLPPAVFDRISEDVYRTISGRETGELLRITRTPDGTPEKLHWATYLCTRSPLAFADTQSLTS